MRSTAVGPSCSATLPSTRSTETPNRARWAAVPSVAAIDNPRSRSLRATTIPAGLSVSFSERKTMPEVGSSLPAASSAFENARPNPVSIPMTSPVDRISGPNAGSTSGNRLNGRTASLTATCPSIGGLRKPSSRSSASVAPIITRVATFASGTPVAFATNGTVRLALGLASMT